jgi:hypothetical protein
MSNYLGCQDGGRLPGRQREIMRQTIDFGLEIDERHKAQGIRHRAIKTFLPYALNLEPYGSLAADY